MTHHLRTLLLLGAMVAAFAIAPAQAQQSDADRINPLAPGTGDVVTLVDDNGKALAEITVIAVEDDWTDYPSNHKPRKGTRYVGFVMEVEALVNNVELDSDDFDLQVDPGLLLDAASVKTANADQPVLKGDIELDRGDTATFVLVYSVPTDTIASHLFWHDDDVLVTIVTASSDAQVVARF